MGLALGGALLGPIAGSVEACSGASVPAEEIRREAARIVVGTIVARQDVGGAPETLVIAVDSVIRGESPRELVLRPPTYMGCDGRILEPIGTRVVVATGQQYFDAAPPADLHPYWVVRADGIAEPVGLDAGGAPGLPLEELAAWLGGTVNEVPATVEPDDTGLLGSVVLPLLVAGIALVAAVTWVARQRDRTA